MKTDFAMGFHAAIEFASKSKRGMTHSEKVSLGHDLSHRSKEYQNGFNYGTKRIVEGLEKMAKEKHLAQGA